MTGEPQIGHLTDGRLHLHHGPIDLIISAEGPDREAAFGAATDRFQGLLEEIVAELDLLTRPCAGQTFRGRITNRMADAIAPFPEEVFVTPMAAVAGAVADEIVETLSRFDLIKASVNNGGDISFLLTSGEVFKAAIATGHVEVTSDQPARGLATSGWSGRSQSLGIADAVSVLARNAARADAAATLIANAVDLPNHPAIRRRPAHEVEAIPQLGDRLVTVEVGALTAKEVTEALARGTDFANTLLSEGLIDGAALLLQGETRVTGFTGITTARAADWPRQAERQHGPINPSPVRVPPPDENLISLDAPGIQRHSPPMTKLALITGASRGLGAAMAERLSETYHIVAVAKTVGGLEELDDRIQAKGGAATLAPLDVTDPDAMAALCQSIRDRWGKLDLWAHAAIHAAPLSPVPHIDAKDMAKSVVVNVTATATLIACVAPLLGTDGSAIFFDDAGASGKFFGSYGSTKAAQMALARSWQAEGANIGPVVHVVAPPPMPTATRARFFPGEDRAALTNPNDAATRLLSQIGILG